MEAKDLMVGDYVYNHRNWECPIVEIHKDSAVVIARHYGEEEFLLSDLRPIPLTPEILEKNGFKFNKEETYGSIQDVYKHYTKFFDFPLGKGFYIEYDTVENTAHITDHWWIRIKYVHELQHALKLCGIEKEIVL